MISSEVERTLVKSPPELWAELSDPTALSRHLGELGEIRIVRTEAESTVEWTAENTTGTVSIKPSGWGTKVKLSVTRELGESPATAAEPASDAASAADAEARQEAEPAQEPEAMLEQEPEIAPANGPVEPEARLGFFARLFGRRRARARQAQTRVEQLAPADEHPPTLLARPADPTEAEAGHASEPADAFAAVRQALAPETFAAVHLFATRPDVERRESATAPVAQSPQTQTTDAPQPSEPVTADASIPDDEPAVDLAAELMAAEEVASEEVTAVLTAVLDRLGAAHHRPFSRA